MPNNRLPDPVYFADPIQGAIDRDGVLYLDPSLSATESITAQGQFVIRYAIPLIVPSTEALLIGLFLSERGQTLTGREAWDYLQNRFQVHPRADVIGLDLRGQPQQVLVKVLDFGVPVRVLAYADLEAHVPLAELYAIQADPETFETLPDLLKRYLLRHA